MRNKLTIFLAVLLVSLMVAGGTFAWFTSNPVATNNIMQIGEIKLEVSGNGFDDLIVTNGGTSDCFVRVILVPQWSNNSLSVSNVTIEVNNDDWAENEGYYYYRYQLGVNESISNLISSITYGDLSSEYEGETFTLKVRAEGVQTTHEAWKDAWGNNSLPFIPGL